MFSRNVPLILAAGFFLPFGCNTDRGPGLDSGTPWCDCYSTTTTSPTTTTTTTTSTGTGTGTTGTGTGTTVNPSVGAINGRAYRFDPGQLVITQPAGTGALAASFIENALLVQVLSQTANTATIRLGLTENLNMPPSQDLCVATTDTTVDWNDPAFTLGPGPFDLAGVGQLEGATLDGVLSNGGAWLEAHLFGEVPASSLTSLVGGDVCPVLSTFGGGCVPCTASVGDCLALESEGVAEEIVGFNLTQRTQQDIVADPGC